MKQIFINVKTFRNDDLVDSLCCEKATAPQLNAILTLAKVGDTVEVTKVECDVNQPIRPFDEVK